MIILPVLLPCSCLYTHLTVCMLFFAIQNSTESTTFQFIFYTHLHIILVQPQCLEEQERCIFVLPARRYFYQMTTHYVIWKMAPSSCLPLPLSHLYQPTLSLPLMCIRCPISQVSISLSLLPHGTLRLLFTSALPSTFGSNSQSKGPISFQCLRLGKFQVLWLSWVVEGAEVNLRFYGSFTKGSA